CINLTRVDSARLPPTCTDRVAELDMTDFKAAEPAAASSAPTMPKTGTKTTRGAHHARRGPRRCDALSPPHRWLAGSMLATHATRLLAIATDDVRHRGESPRLGFFRPSGTHAGPRRVASCDGQLESRFQEAPQMSGTSRLEAIPISIDKLD